MELEISAYHEAGHIVASYMNGYKCKGFYLTGSGDGVSGLDFGEDKELTHAIFHCYENGSLFNNLSKNEKLKTPQVAGKIIEILLAGPVAESIYKHGSTTSLKRDVEISGEDLIYVDAVKYVLKNLNLIDETSFIENELERTYQIFIKAPGIQKAVDALANAILKSEDYIMLGDEVEQVLRNIGFIN